MKKIIPLILVVIVVVGVGLGVHYFIGWDVVIGKITGDKIETTCKVSYEFDGVQVLEVKKGEMFSLETIPSKIGHTFKGLYDAPAGGNQIVSPTGVSIATFSIDKDIVLYAQWDAITYMVNFVDGNSLVTQYEVQYGETLISLPDAPIKQGHVFDCWSTKVEGNDKIIADQNGFHVGSNVVDENNFQLAYNIYIDANYTLETYDVNFYYSESSNDFVTKKIAYGTNISEILITNNAGTETVIKWSKNRNDTAGTAIFNDVITRPMNLYAQAWGYNLTIDYNHSLIENTKALLPKGEVIQQPEMSLPTGIRLVGWYNNDNLISFPFSLDSNTTIKAKYEAKVTFDFGVLNKPDVVITIEPGTIVTASEITDILPEGVRLKGWFEGVSQKTFPRMVTEDSVFVAKYEAQVNYITNGANEPNKTIWVEVDTRIPSYTLTFNKYYDYKGWEYNGNLINELPICPFNSVTLNAKATTDYIFVRNVDDFKNIKNNMDGKYALMSNINLGNSWTPMGTYVWEHYDRDDVVNNPFNGTLDGNGYTITYGTTISGLMAHKDYGWGLFGTAENAKFVDLKISANVYSNNANENCRELSAGGLVGFAKNCTFTNCEIVSGSSIRNYGTEETYYVFLEGMYYTGNTFAGGLVGDARWCNFNKCRNYATVYTSGYQAYSGGIAGSGYKCENSSCSSSSSVTATHGDWIWGEHASAEIFGKTNDYWIRIDNGEASH